MRNISTIIASGLLLFGLLGCIEHTYTIRVLPEDQLELKYEARGDRIDLMDGRELFPDSTTWTIEWSEEQSDEETVHVLSATIPPQPLSSLSQVMDWTQTSADSIHLKRTVTLEKKEMLFGIKWEFNSTFFSRRFDERYGSIWDFVPDECRVLDDEEVKKTLMPKELELLENKFALGILQWNRARFVRRFDNVWDILKQKHPTLSDASESLYEEARVLWEKDLHQYLNKLDIKDPTIADLNWWDDIGGLFAKRMTLIASKSFLDEIILTSDALELEYQITKDSEDDQFNFKLFLPGRLTDSNADDKDEDGLEVWSFYGRDLLNGDEQLSASSFEPSIWKIGIAAFLAIIILIILKRLIIRPKVKMSLEYR